MPIFLNYATRNTTYKQKTLDKIKGLDLPQTGIEPVREYKSRRILSPVRLPVPPLRHSLECKPF